RVNYGINGAPERILLGRRVILNNYMDSYSQTVEKDTVVAFLFNPADYVLNTNYSMGIKKYTDEETDDLVTRAIMIADGKVVIKDSLVTVTKKKA
ncbi:phage major capsid protein, partial [Clostridium botulinum]|uniref:phage major capsid family protein n=1 Tax=Clostridium botulinum TaxID=1491 RepID=UPI001967DD01